MEAKKRILLVDDEPNSLEFFDVMLSKLGFDIKKAENGEVALQTLKRWKPDLIMLDNVMPKLSGWEVTKILKTSNEYRDFSEIPIIMLSAMDDVKDKVEGLELGADDYITKPFNFSEVLARIRAVLRTRELVSQIEARDARLAIAEKMNRETLELANSFRDPLNRLIEDSKKIKPIDRDTKAFLGRAQTGAEEALKNLDAAIERVSSLAHEDEDLRKGETSLSTLKKNLKSQGS